MRWLVHRFFRADRPYWRAVITLGFVAVVPSLLLVNLVVFILLMVGIDPAPYTPDHDLLDPTFMLVSLLIAPLLETLILAGGLAVLTRFIRSPIRAAAVSGVLWGMLHGVNAPLWFVGTFWAFFVFSLAYLTWRPKGPASAIGAAWIPHLVQNSVAVGLSLLARAL